MCAERVNYRALCVHLEPAGTEARRSLGCWGRAAAPQPLPSSSPPAAVPGAVRRERSGAAAGLSGSDGDGAAMEILVIVRLCCNCTYGEERGAAPVWGAGGE